MITDNSTRSIITSVGSSIILQCWATGMPTPSLSWRKENNDLLPTGGSVYRGSILVLHNVSVSDRGTYFCIGDNGVGKPGKRNVAVEIEFLPIVAATSNKYYQAIGYPADLECTVESFPLPSTIEWTFGHHRILDDSNYQISIQSDSHTVMSTRLRINNVQRKNLGTYSCSAGNKLGFAQSQIQLLESDTGPVCPPSCPSYQSIDVNLRPFAALIFISICLPHFLFKYFNVNCNL